jgi:heme-degrading monooxygenase HmoA
MIVRTWSAVASPAGADGYCRHFEATILPSLRGIDGFRGAYVLRRERGDQVEVVDLTLWDSMDAVRGFAGEDVETAVVDEHARSLLVDYDDTVAHHTVALDTFG